MISRKNLGPNAAAIRLRRSAVAVDGGGMSVADCGVVINSFALSGLFALDAVPAAYAAGFILLPLRGCATSNRVRNIESDDLRKTSFLDSRPVAHSSPLTAAS